MNFSGLLGFKYPKVKCVANGLEESAKFCPPEKKPDIATIDPLPCNPHDCNPYTWVSVKGVCSVSCGTGESCIGVLHLRLYNFMYPFICISLALLSTSLADK